MVNEVYKAISTRLSALFNPDGRHLHRYLNERPILVNSLCEDLILQDQVLIPTQDYLTACGLILLLGEKGFIELLERDRLKFIRTAGVFAFIRGTGRDGGLAIASDPDQKRPQDAPLEESVAAGLRVIEDRIHETETLQKLIVSNSLSTDWSTILGAVTREAISDLKQTPLWKPKYSTQHDGLLSLPGMKKLQARVIGPDHDPGGNAVDALLALVLLNSEQYLANEYACQDVSTRYAVGDLLDLKQKRLQHSNIGSSDKLWTLLEVNRIPDLSQVDLSAGSTFRDLLKVVSGDHARDFRAWFHENRNLAQEEILKEYIDVLLRVPWTQNMPTRVLRFVATSLTGLLPGVGQAASLFDAFIFDRLFRSKSPRFFVDNLRRVSGQWVERRS